jgi:hypothetical protein
MDDYGSHITLYLYILDKSASVLQTKGKAKTIAKKHYMHVLIYTSHQHQMFPNI